MVTREDVQDDPGLLSTITGAGLTPVVRFDGIPRDPDALTDWIGEFKRIIVNPGLNNNVSLYIFGNEPSLGIEVEGGQGFTPADYAAAYVQLWQHVHIDEGEDGPAISTDDARILIAGPAAHRLDTLTWLRDVTEYIKDTEAEVDGYAIHTYGFGEEYRVNWSERPQGVRNIAQELLNLAVRPEAGENADIEDLADLGCGDPSDPSKACVGIGDSWPGDHSFWNYKDQLRELAEVIDLTDIPVYITEFNPHAWGDGDRLGNPDVYFSQHNPNSPYVPANNYPTGWIVDAVEDVNSYNRSVTPAEGRVEAILWFVGALRKNPEEITDLDDNTFLADWHQFALTHVNEPPRRLPCARQDFESITLNQPACAEQASLPIMYVSIVTDQCVPVGTTLIGSTSEVAADRLEIRASPVQTFDLSWAKPNTVYAGTFDWVPPEGSTATFTLYDQAGNFTQKEVYNPGPQQCGGGGGPGGDHPDDNESDADLVLGSNFFTLPPGSRSTPRVAILNRGFPQQLWETVLKLGEPAVLLDLDFDPTAAAEQYPVLFIPSGGLYGLENSLLFKKRLELYAEAGGTVVALAQQHGYEYNVLPGAGEPATVSGALYGAGEDQSRLSAYGWSEDNSCYSASLLLGAEHPALSGFSQTHLTAHVDGYFATYPEMAVPLLTRSQNGMPGTIIYPWPADGSGGRIVVSSIYDDWGASQGQITSDTRTLLRDLLSWAIAPDEPVSYAPGDPVTLVVPVTNDTEDDAVAIRLSLINPARDIVETQDITTTLAAGEGTDLTFETTAGSPLGIWRLDVTLLNGRAMPISRRIPTAYFSVVDPPETIATNRPLSLGITAPTDRFSRGERAEFTFHVFNNSTEERSVTVRYGLPHHTWEKGTDPNTGQSYGLFYNLSRNLTVPAQSEATFVYSPTLLTRDRLWARLDEGGSIRTYAHFAVYSTRPDDYHISDPILDASQYGRGSEVQVSALVSRAARPVRPDLDVRLTATDAEGQVIHRSIDSLTEAMIDPVSGDGQINKTFVVSPTAAGGVAGLRLEVGRADSTGYFARYGSAQTTFRISPSPLGGYFAGDLAVIPGQVQAVPLNLTNLNPFLDVNQGQVDLELRDGVTSLASGSSQPFSLAAGEQTMVTTTLAVPQLSFEGDYRFAVILTDEYDQQQWSSARLPLTHTVEVEFNRNEYRVRETAVSTLTLHNPGPFVQDLTLDLAVPTLNFAESRTVSLNPGQTRAETYSISIPAATSPGLHSLVVTATLPAGSRRVAQPGRLYVPESQLRPGLLDLPATAGDVVTTTVSNVGGVDTTAAYILNVYDTQGLAVAAVSGTGQAAPAGEAPAEIPLMLPDQLRTGNYSLSGLITDETTGRETPVYRIFSLTGQTVDLSALTDAETYLTAAPIQTTAVITNLGRSLNEGQLALRIAAPARPPQRLSGWSIPRPAVSPMTW